MCLLIDAQKGVLSQTKRHLSIAHLLNPEQVIVAINKMNLVNYSEANFNTLCDDVKTSAKVFNIDLHIHSISTYTFEDESFTRFKGKIPWYNRPDLIALLNSFQPSAIQQQTFRLNVQSVIRKNQMTSKNTEPTQV